MLRFSFAFFFAPGRPVSETSKPPNGDIDLYFPKKNDEDVGDVLQKAVPENSRRLLGRRKHGSPLSARSVLSKGCLSINLATSFPRDLDAALCKFMTTK